MNERRFTDEQVREILRKAVEDAPATALLKGEGLTLSQLKEIGAEVGIDAERLERAVWAVDHDVTSGTGSRILGPRIHNTQRKVAGSLPDNASSEVLGAIRRHLGRAGDVSGRDDAVEWTATGEIGEQHVSVSTRDGVTTVTGWANLSSAAVLAYVPPGLLGGIASAVGFMVSANDANAVGMGLSLAILPTTLGIARSLFGTFSRAQAARLEQVVAEIAALVEE